MTRPALRYAPALAAVLALGCSPPDLSADRSGEVIPAAVARDHCDRVCTVELMVRSSKHEADRRVVYLDSEADYSDSKNLAVVIGEADLSRFRAGGIDSPHEFYRGKRLRVRGKVVFDDDQYQIHVADPASITVVTTP